MDTKNWDYNRQEPIVSNTSDDSFDFQEFLGKIYENWVLVMVSLTIAIILAFLVNRYVARVYYVQTTVLINNPKESGSSSVSSLLYGSEVFGRGSGSLENEAQLLKSTALVSKTLRELDFQVSYFVDGQVRDEELYKRSPIAVTIDSASTWTPTGQRINCTRVDNNTYLLSIDKGNILARYRNIFEDKEEDPFAGKKFEFGKFYDINGFRFYLRLQSQKQEELDGEIYFIVNDYNRLTKSYQNRIVADPFSETASILNIGIAGPTPAKLRDFVDKLVENYINNELDQKNYTASKTIDFINRQIAFMSDSLNLVEDRMEEFKKSNTTQDLSDEGSSLYSSSQQAEVQRSQIRLQNRYLSNLEQIINSNNLDEIIIPSSIGLDDPNLNSLVTELSRLQLDVKLMESDKNLSNPLIRINQRKIEGLKISILETTRNLISQNNFQVRQLDSTIGGIRASMRNLPTAERELINIQRNYDLSEKLYLLLIEKKAEAGIAKASNTIDFRIINPAEQSLGPIKPNKKLNYVTAILLGLGFPILLLYLKEVLNNKVTSKDQLMRLAHLPLLGLVASSKERTPLKKDVYVKSAISESFRTIRSNLRYMLNGKQGGKVFLVTSSISGEGKSFCSNNLAVVFSSLGKKVCLVNTDMRKINDYSEFDINDDIGLSDYLAGLATTSQIIRKTKYPNLSIITSGGLPPNPSELLITGKIDELLDELTGIFDYIILDTPPIGILADAMELINKADVNIFVVRQNYTLKKQVMEATTNFAHKRMRNLALLLNDVNFKSLNYGYAYYKIK